MGGKGARGCVQTEEWRMRAMVVLLVDRFSTMHHGKTVEDERDPLFFLFSPLLFPPLSSFSFYSAERRTTRAVTKGHDEGVRVGVGGGGRDAGFHDF